MSDELYDVRNSLYIGNYHQTIAEGGNVRTVSKKHDDQQAFYTERDALVAMAQVSLGQHDLVINDLRNTNHGTLIAVRLWAELHKSLSTGGNGMEPVDSLVQLLNQTYPTPSHAGAPAAVLAASAYMHVKDYASALTLAAGWVAGLDSATSARYIVELRAVCTDAYLRLNCLDLAEKEVKQMYAVDDEHVLSILYAGLVALRQGITKPDKYTEAQANFVEIAGRCGQSVMSLNLQALANIGQGKYQDAERNLLDALAKKSGDPDTLANLIVVASQLGKPVENTQWHIQQAKGAPFAPWTMSYTSMEQRFDDAVNALGLSQ